jgi:hypothetical protein
MMDALAAYDAALVAANATTSIPSSLANDTCICYPIYVDGHMYNRNIAQFFAECLYTARDFVAFGIGMSSILFWIICQMPQLISNCKNQSVAALSVWFLVQWMSGDVMNLGGCFLTNQLLTQKATAVLYIIMDVIVIVQYIYYDKCHKKGKKPAGTESMKDPVSDRDTYTDDDERYVPDSRLTCVVG